MNKSEIDVFLKNGFPINKVLRIVFHYKPFIRIGFYSFYKFKMLLFSSLLENNHFH